MAATPSIPATTAIALGTLIQYTEHGVTSRVLAKTSGGSVTLFAFDAGESLSEHTAPFDALVLVVEGALELTIGGERVEAQSGTIVRMPGGVPHALEAPVPSRMLLIMLRAERGTEPFSTAPAPEGTETPPSPSGR
jgi:quercetin dioxygenase-like cupin family protein